MADKERILTLIDEMIKEAQEEPQWKAESALKCLKKELLKEHEAKPIVYTDNPYTGLPVAHCPKCGRFARQFHMAQPGEETHFCPWCGQGLKWND